MTFMPRVSKYLVLSVSYSWTFAAKCGAPSKLDSEPVLRTVKIDNVATYADLSAEFLAKKLSALQTCPEDGLRRSG